MLIHLSSFLSLLAYFLKDFFNFVWKLYFLSQKLEHMVIYFKNLLFLIYPCDHSAFIAQNIFDNIRLENKECQLKVIYRFHQNLYLLDFKLNDLFFWASCKNSTYKLPLKIICISCSICKEIHVEEGLL